MEQKNQPEGHYPSCGPVLHCLELLFGVSWRQVAHLWLTCSALSLVLGTACEISLGFLFQHLPDSENSRGAFPALCPRLL